MLGTFVRGNGLERGAPRARRAARAIASVFVQLAVLAVLALNPACSSCGSCSEHGAVTEGPHDYVRCMAVDAPEAANGTLGSTRWAIADRTLTLRGAPTPLRIASFRGASMLAPGLADAVAAVEEQAPGLVFVLGGLGPDAASARAHLDAFGTLGVPVVVLPGGDDVAEVFGEGLEAAIAQHPNLFDGRRLRAVVVGDDTFLLLSGAPEGRYAASAQACGNGEADRDELDDVPGRRRWLVSWAAPAGGGAAAVGRGFEGLDAGDTRIAAWLAEAHVRGGLFAWPETRALVPADAEGTRALAAGAVDPGLRLVVPRLTGASAERDDLSLGETGAAVLELSSGGLAFTGNTAGGG